MPESPSWVVAWPGSWRLQQQGVRDVVLFEAHTTLGDFGRRLF
jgi:hypothetical protein